MGQESIATTTTVGNVVGGGKFVHIGVFLFICLGLALLYPINTIISATDWFMYIYPTTANISGVLSNADFVASVITTFLILIFASPKEVKDPNINSAALTSSTSSLRHAAYTKGLSIFVNLHVRIYTGFFLVALSLLVYAVSVPSVGVAIAMGYVMGIGDATAQSGIYPLAGGIHPRCTAAASLGGAVAGLAAGLLRLLTKAVFPTDDTGQRLSSSVYFGLAVIIIAICAVALAIISKYKSELTLAFFHQEHAENTSSFLLESDVIKRNIQIELQDEINMTNVPEQANNKEVELGDSLQSTTANEASSSSGRKGGVFSVCLEGSLVYREAFKCAWLPIMAQFVNFLLTLSLFPGVLLSMQSESLGTWLPVILATAFNFGDTLGRVVQLSHSVSNWIVTPVGHKILSSTTGEHLGHYCPRMKYSIVLPLVLRFGFIPLIILCVNPLVIVNDPVRIIITILFALSSGWVYSACFMVASDMCRQLKHKEAASLLMVVSTLVALGIGSSAGLAIADALI